MARGKYKAKVLPAVNVDYLKRELKVLDELILECSVRVGCYRRRYAELKYLIKEVEDGK